MSGSRKSPMSSEDFNSDMNELTVKEETNSKEDELAEEFMTSIHTTQSSSIYHLVPHMDIKQEEMDFHSNTSKSTSNHEAYCDQEFDTASSTYSYVDCSTVKHENKELKDSFLDLLQCQRDCETCQRYLKMLSEHIRSTHPSKTIQDPLNIDPLNLDPDPPHTEQSTSSIQIKCQVEESIDKMDSSQEEDSRLNSDPEFESQSESDLLDVCEKSFSRSSDITSHKRRHTGERRYKCDQCEKSFTHKSSLSVHGKTHTGEKSYECTVCLKSFSQKSHLTVHNRSHTGEKPYRCDVCDKSFTTSDILNTHKRRHTGERLFQCDVCEKSFVTAGDLTNHKRIHTGKKPFECTVCAKSYSLKSSLTVHMRSHTGEKHYGCTLCEKRFTSSTSLTSHKKIHAGQTS